MRILLDENIDYPAGALLKSRGFDTVHVRDTVVRGCSDSAVLDLARNEGRVLVTFDADFADIRRFPPAHHAGVIRLRLRRTVWATLQHVLPALLARLEDTTLQGRLVVATESRFRIR